MRYAHFSFDDTMGLLEKLTQHAARGGALFDEPTMAELMRLHRAYGLKASLFCFLEDPDTGFSLAGCTRAYAGELAQNSDWLRFGFHGRSARRRYAEGDGEALVRDYAETMEQLAAITGGNEAIDAFPRIHYAAAPRDGLEALAGRFGIAGVVGADDDRLEYYLTPAQNDILLEKRLYADPENGLKILISERRLEGLPSTMEEFLARPELLARLDSGAPIAFFTHEDKWYSRPEIPPRVEALCRWLSEHGCRFAFPADIA